MMLARDIANRPDWIQLGQMMQNKGLTYMKSAILKEYMPMQSPRKSSELPTIKSVVES